MNEEIVVARPSDGEAKASSFNRQNTDVHKIVLGQEALQTNVPRLIYGLLVGGPLLMNVVSHGELRFSAILGAGLWFLVAKFLVWLVRITLLYPLQNARFDQATKKLKRQLAATWPLSLGPFTWTIGAPGVLGATASGELIVIDRSTQYRPIIIPARCIADVRVECRSQLVTTTKHGSRGMIGTAAGPIGLGLVSGGRSSSVSRQVNEFFLEIRYQTQRNGEVSTLVIPGGPDHRVVEELCAAIRRLEADD